MSLTILCPPSQIAAVASQTSDFLVADGQCPKIRELLAEALVPVLWLDGEREPLQAITDALAHRRKQGLPTQTLHWVSHGQPGVLQVGQNRVDRAALLAASDQLSHWQVDQLALWACDYGADNSTLSLWEELVGASVFSSSVILGVNFQGRKNWTLHSKEHSKTIDWPLHLGDSHNWDHQLATVSYATFSEGPQANDPLTSSEQITAVGYTSDAYTSYITGLVEGTFDAITNLSYTNSEADYSFLDSTIEADLIYIIFPDSVPTTSQLNNLKQFVEGGGTLLISGEWSPSFDTVNGNASQILAHVGSSIAVKQGGGKIIDSTLNATPPAGSTDIIEIGNFDITSGLKTVKTDAFGALEIDNESAEAILVTSNDATNNIVMAREAVGNGNAIVFADVNVFDSDNNNLFSNIIIQSKLNIEEAAVNNAPAGTDNTITISEDGSHTFAASDFGFTDTDGNNLHAVIITSLPAAGSLTLDGTAVSAAQSVAAADLTKLLFTPIADANGTAYSSFTFQVQDDGGTENDGVDTDQSANTITFDVTAVNDASVITADSTGSLTENSSTSNVTGSIAISDVDTDDSPSFDDVDSTTTSNGYGSYSLSSGTWTYTLDNSNTTVNALNAGDTLTDSFTLTASDNSTQSIAISITGADDAAVITGDTSGSITEDSDTTSTVTGSIAISDVDTDDSPSFDDVDSTTTSNGYGSYSLSSGSWTYTLDNSNTTVNALNAGDTLTDSFTLTASDNSTQSIAITINGATDPTPTPTPTPTPAPTPTPTPTPTPEPEPTPEPDTDTGFIIVTPTPSASDDDETSETNSQEAVESQTITNTSSTETGSAALVENSGNNDNLVTATLPPGVTITSEGSAVAQSTTAAQDTLTASLDVRDSSSETKLINAAISFVQQLPQTSMVDVRTITPTTTSSAPDQPIVITGSTPAQGDSESNTQTEAFVIDLTQMPSAAPTQLQLHSIDLAVIFGAAVITGGTGSNVLIADNAPQRIVLGEDNDTLDGGGGNDTIGSAAGDDLLIGGNGRDLISGGADNDTLDGGTHADTLVGGSGNDVLSGGRGRDTLRGSSGDDILKGQDFHDLLKGNKGNDTLIGGKGNDILKGGAGSDTFRLTKGKDTIKDFSINDGDVIEAPNNSNLLLIQRGDHLLLKDNDHNIKTTILNINQDDLLQHQPDLI